MLTPRTDRMRRHHAPLKPGRSDSAVRSRLVRSRRRCVHAEETPPCCRALWCHRSVLELLHDAPVPTILTTGTSHRSSGPATVCSSAEPPPPLRALFGKPLLPEMPQSSPPPHRVSLAAIPDPPSRRPAPGSGWPPPPLLRTPIPSPSSTWATPALVLRWAAPA
jgi:hypothetical protein